MIERLDRAIKEASASPEAQKMRGEAEKATESLRVAGEQTWQEVHSHLLSALSQINAELERIISRLKQEEPTSEVPAVQVVPDEPDGN